VYFGADVADVLRRLKLQIRAVQAGGPFIGMGDNLSRMWGRIRKAADVPNVSLHDLRRTYVSRLLRGGESLPTVQALAGHEDLKTTMRYYAHVAQEDLRGSVAKLQKGKIAGRFRGIVRPPVHAIRYVPDFGASRAARPYVGTVC